MKCQIKIFGGFPTYNTHTITILYQWHVMYGVLGEGWYISKGTGLVLLHHTEYTPRIFPISNEPLVTLYVIVGPT